MPHEERNEKKKNGGQNKPAILSNMFTFPLIPEITHNLSMWKALVSNGQNARKKQRASEAERKREKPERV